MYCTPWRRILNNTLQQVGASGNSTVVRDRSVPETVTRDLGLPENGRETSELDASGAVVGNGFSGFQVELRSALSMGAQQAFSACRVAGRLLLRTLASWQLVRT